MTVVFKHLFKPIVTMQYPEEKWRPYARFRGAPGLDTKKCAVCCMCTNVCPAGAITIIGKENEKGEKLIEKFEIDASRCIYCGLCAEYCPRSAIILTGGYELSVFDKKELIYDLAHLEDNVKKYMINDEGGVIEKTKK
ncbi:NADH-quinone oxidoreductase subunit I [Candidatus Desantisbacteria bacterium]|nr:NADH-quinone oxidoreductase subunit I [Candidatus Desantisbacteria bacterium]